VDDSILTSIAKGGFPEKSVKLPFRPVYDSCKRNDTSLAEVLARLRGRGVVGKIVVDGILFHPPERPPPVAPAPVVPDPAWLQGAGDPAFLQSLAGNFFAGMTPEQMDEIRARFEGMSEADKQKFFEMLPKLTDPQP
jgi:hypothetical protein